MHQHRYPTRSKGAAPDAIASDDASVQHTLPSYSIGPTQISNSDALDGKERSDATGALANDSNIATTIPRLFTLPPEVQNIIYELAVIEAEPIELHLWPATRDRNATVWRIRTSVGFWFRVPHPRPSVLMVCKYLRQTVAPIYFSGNTFLTRAMHTAGPLRRMWGEDVKHIRSIFNTIEVDIAWWDTHDGQHPGHWREETVAIDTQMNLLPDGSLAIKRQSSGTYLSKTLAYKGEMCQCKLERVMATPSAPAKDSRRLFEVVVSCAKEHQKLSKVKTCGQCGEEMRAYGSEFPLMRRFGQKGGKESEHGKSQCLASRASF
ncbi:hypothetical protein M409DRAFT_52995 [Zasmidium cellare ATCC 36951]|uniref:F-box domain-containing protein n=1 Tax=Zasmidium cellare ATCC 36951 TaxID=1080233 RepID=A0A6A6CPG3_ZASCE|nr:uncharacterized protein M409DRAFT_52995 [Zasmidium cellare ATCC 36951]KAF2169024.1 hypothetical protein M409DRAFT_52995 [Zasmidium cellare ATCC 36951]